MESSNKNLDTALKDFNPTVQGTDLKTGFFGQTTNATQADVEAGRATQVGQKMGETAGLAQAEQDSLTEILSDAGDRFDLKDAASLDKFNNDMPSLAVEMYSKKFKIGYELGLLKQKLLSFIE